MKWCWRIIINGPVWRNVPHLAILTSFADSWPSRMCTTQSASMVFVAFDLCNKIGTHAWETCAGTRTQAQLLARTCQEPLTHSHWYIHDMMIYLIWICRKLGTIAICNYPDVVLTPKTYPTALINAWQVEWVEVQWLTLLTCSTHICFLLAVCRWWDSRSIWEWYSLLSCALVFVFVLFCLYEYVY